MSPAESDSTSTPVRSSLVSDSREPQNERAASREGRLWTWCGLALVLCVALGLRLWGIKEGLPYVYNIDEAGHFVPKAVTMFSDGLNPRYFVNPPALTYVLHFVLDAWFGGAHGVRSEYARHPDEVFLVGRVTVALLGTAAVWMLYLLGARLFDRRIGLLAAAIEAVAFLPVSYGHLALNDAVTLLPLTLSLFGSAGVMRYGRKRDYVLAGIGLGLACASKYTAGIAIVPLVVATATHYLDSIDRAGDNSIPVNAGRRVVLGVALAGVCALVSFLVANPYALLDFKLFYSELVHQSSLSDEAQGKLGAPKEIGILYYLWSFSWGLGWVPALAVLGGAITIWRRHARIGWLLVPAAVLFLGFMGLQDRYFGRWVLPIFPIVCVLAAYFASRLACVIVKNAMPPARAGGRQIVAAPKMPKVKDAGAVSDRHLASGVAAVSGAPRSSLRQGFVLLAGGLIAIVLLAQGVVYSVHNDLVLSRADTRNITRAWMVAHVPRGTPIVVEPVVLDSWVEEDRNASRSDRWLKYQSLQSVIAPDGSLAPQTIHQVTLEDYETTLSPALIGWYEHLGYCWVVVGSTESGRALADPRAAPFASAYYHALATQAEVAYRVSPYSTGSSPTRFSFDWSFDYYPLSYAHPGPEMTVYRLRDGRCARSH